MNNTILDFYESTLSNNGASFNVTTNELNPQNGFFVSLPQYEQKIPLSSFTVEVINGYISSKKELQANKTFIGSWINNDVIYLDISERITDKRLAVETAYKNNQLALYDANNGCVIELPTKQVSGTYAQQKAYLTSVIDRLCK